MTPIGNFQLATISGGRYLIDGGTMFGVVPKPLWERRIPADEKNRIPQPTNCVLVKTGQQNVLIDSGYGTKLPDKQMKILSAEEGDPLATSLQSEGLDFDAIDVVILSHLHFDHAGGCTRYDDESGNLVTTFPNAEFVVQRREWNTATAGLPELRGVYPQENLLPLQESGRLRLIDGDARILPGIHSILTGGHTQWHQSIMIEDGGEAAIYLADLCPTTHHLPTLWGMSYDVDVLQIRRKKPELLSRIVENNWLALFDHDPDFVAARLERDDRRDFAVTETYPRL